MTSPADAPAWPLRVTFSDGTEELVADRAEAVMNLEWFDSEDSTDPSTVIDAQGRRVVLVLEALQLLECRLK